MELAGKDHQTTDEDTDQVGNETSTPDALDSVLGRLRLLLAVDDRDVRDVDVDKVVLASSVTELGEGLNERHALNITDSTALLGVSRRHD